MSYLEVLQRCANVAPMDKSTLAWHHLLTLRQHKLQRWPNISLLAGLMPSDNKPLEESMLTQIYVAIWCHSSIRTKQHGIKHVVRNMTKAEEACMEYQLRLVPTVQVYYIRLGKFVSLKW